MINKLKLLYCLMAICMMAACSNDSSEGSPTPPETVSFSVTGGSFDNGAEISVTAYNSDGTAIQENTLYSYSNGTFSCNDDSSTLETGDASYYRVVYPYATINSDLALDFEVKEDQSSSDNLTLSDLQYSYTTSTSFAFQHLMPKIVINIVTDDTSVASIKASVNLTAGVAYDLTNLNSTPSGSAKDIVMANDGNLYHSAFVAPQTINTASAFITIKVNDTDYYYCEATEEEVTLLAGEEYVVDVEFESGVMTTTYWYEEPTTVPQGWIAIYTAEQLAKIGVDVDYPLDGSYILMNNIPLSGYWTPIGGVDYNNNTLLNVTDSYPFTGVFDGNNYTISGINVSSDKTYLGLFGYIDGATIENITLDSPSVIISESPYTANIGYNGTLVGYATNSTIKRCGVSEGYVSGYKYTGGVVGMITDNTEIIACYFNGEVNGKGPYAGGVVAYAEESIVVACYNTGEIGSCAYEGGVVGCLDDSDIIGCYNTGEVTLGYTCNGAVVGWMLGESTFSENYYIDLWSSAGVGQNFAGITLPDDYSFSYGENLSSFVLAMNTAISSFEYTDVEYTVESYGYGPSLMEEAFVLPIIQTN